MTAILFGQIPEIPQVVMNQANSLDLPIVINNDQGFNSATIEVQYDSDVITIIDIVMDPNDILSSDFSFNLTPIYLSILEYRCLI